MLDLGSTALLLFLLLAAAGVGYFVRARLPEKHRSQELLILVQLTINLLVTFTAIVLGLLTTSVKAGFDAAYNARGTYAAEFAQLDEYLREYGSETDNIREQLRAYVAAVIASTWPDETPPAGVKYPDVSHMPLTGESHVLGAIINAVGREIDLLEPKDQLQRRLQDQSEDQYSGLVKTRWRVIEGARGSISPPFYWVLVLWLVILFASLGLTAPANRVTILVIALSALSITVAVFVIIDLDLPYGGLFSIPSTSMRDALADMMR